MHCKLSPIKLIYAGLTAVILTCWTNPCTNATAQSSNTDASYYPTRDHWEKVGGGNINISGFVFRDRNRNGVYDLQDRPMAHVAFELVGPKGTNIVRRSNISGFANFKMSGLGRDADIVHPGVYEYRTKIPPGWKLTTGNAVQRTFFEILLGSPAGMISSTPTTPVGLAPDLNIAGRVRSTVNSDITLTATSPNGKKQRTTVDADGKFHISAIPGTWLVEVVDALAGDHTERTVTVGQTPVLMSTITVGRSDGRIESDARSIGFDDLTTTESIQEIPVGYGGLGWQNWVVTHNRNYKGEGYINTTMSGDFIAYNSSGHPVKIFSDNPFDFVGGYFGVAWAKAEGEVLKIRAWRNEDLAYEDSLQLSMLGPVYFDANYHAVTRMEFVTQHFWQFVCDDLLVRSMR